MALVEMHSMNEAAFTQVISDYRKFKSLDDKSRGIKKKFSSNSKMTRTETLKGHLKPLLQSFSRSHLIQSRLNECFQLLKEGDRRYCKDEYDKSTSGAWSLIPCEELEQIDRVIKSNPTIAICGEVNSGKSSLINCLLGEELLPVSEVLLTCQALELTKSTDPSSRSKISIHRSTRVDFKKGQSLIAANVNDARNLLFDILEECVENSIPSKSDRSQPYIQIEAPHPLLQKNFKIIEFPPIDGSKTYQPVSEYLHSNPLSMVIYTIDTTDLITKETEQFLNYLSHTHPQVPVFFVLTKVDSETEEVNIRDRKSPSTSTNANHREHKTVQDTMIHLMKMDQLLRPNPDHCDAFNLTSVSLIDPQDFTNTDIIKLMLKVGTWTKEMFGRLISPAQNKMYLMSHAVTISVFSRRPNEDICEDLRNLFQRLKDENKIHRRCAVKKVRTVVEEAKPRITKNLFEVISSLRRPPPPGSSKLGSRPRLAMGLNIRAADPEADYEEELTYQIRTQTQKEVEACLRKHPELLAEIRHQRRELMSTMKSKLKYISQCHELADTDLGKIVRLISETCSSLLPQISFRTHPKALFGEETLLKKLSHWLVGIRNAASSRFAAVTTNMAATDLTAARSTNNLAPNRNRHELVEGIYRRICPEKIVSDNFDVVDQLLNQLAAHVELFMSIQTAYFDSRRFSFQQENNDLFYLSELLMMASKTTLDRGACRYEEIPYQALYNRPSLFNTISLEIDDEKKRSRRMIRRITTDKSKDLRVCLNVRLCQHLRLWRSNHILEIDDFAFDCQNNLLLMTPLMDTDLFLVLQESSLYREIIKFHEVKVRLQIFSQVLAGCQDLVDAFKCDFRMDLRPEKILMTHKSVKLYFGENFSETEKYPDGSGPYYFSSSPSFQQSRKMKVAEHYYQNNLRLQLALLMWWLCAEILCEPPSISSVEKTSDMSVLTQHLSKPMAQKILSRQQSGRGEEKLVNLMHILLFTDLHLSHIQATIETYKKDLT